MLTSDFEARIRGAFFVSIMPPRDGQGWRVNVRLTEDRGYTCGRLKPTLSEALDDVLQPPRRAMTLEDLGL